VIIAERYITGTRMSRTLDAGQLIEEASPVGQLEVLEHVTSPVVDVQFRKKRRQRSEARMPQLAVRDKGQRQPGVAHSVLCGGRLAGVVSGRPDVLVGKVTIDGDRVNYDTAPTGTRKFARLKITDP